MTIKERNLGYTSSAQSVWDDLYVDSYSNKIDEKYLADSVDLWLYNTYSLYNEIGNRRRKAYSVVYEALLSLLQTNVDDNLEGKKVRVTSEMVKGWFKKHNADFKEILKPVVDTVEESRQEMFDESSFSKRNNKKSSIKEKTEKGSLDNMLTMFNSKIEDLEFEDFDESTDSRNHPYWMDDDVGFDIPWDENGFAISDLDDRDIYDDEDEDSFTESRELHTWNVTYTGKDNKIKNHIVDAPDAYEANRKARRQLGISYTDIDDVSMVENKNVKESMRKINSKRKFMRNIKESINHNIDVNRLARQVNDAIKEAVSYIDSGEAYPTWHWFLDSDGEYDYELVLGFSSGFTPNENEFTDSYGDALCLKWARINKNSAMNEYDVDYESPYDEETDEVWDSEIAVYSYDETDTVKWLIKDFEEYANQNLFIDESLNRKSVRENSMKLKTNEVRHSELSPSYDSRKSFYGKAHIVTDDDGSEILYSYDTPVVKIKDGKVELLAQWDSSQTTLRHVKEFLQQNGFKAGSKAQIAKMYGTTVESYRKIRKNN